MPIQARSALSKLVSINNIDGLPGSYCVIGMVASESILEYAKVISFQTSGGTKEILDSGEYLFFTTKDAKDTKVAFKTFVSLASFVVKI